jgi:cytochrome c oxidase assembly protein subunit 15
MSEPRLWGLPPWFKKSYNLLVLEVFLLIAIGGSVRIMNAGLACPDWPLCFGDYIPDFHPQVYFEFIHRVMAGLVSIGVVTLNFVLFRSEAPRRLKWAGTASLLILLAQIIFGALTVRLLLSPPIVATHLFLGTAFFLSLLWIYLRVRDAGAATPAAPRVKEGANLTHLRLQSSLVFLTVYTQVILGGLVAANFASLVCIEFPTCHGEWFPTWSGIIGLHMIHRYFAYFTFLVILGNLLTVRRFVIDPRLRKIAGWMFIGVCVQVCLGIANVLLLTPPLIAVLHLATGVTVLSIALRQIHAARVYA